MFVLIEGKEDMAYHLSVDLGSERYSVIDSDIPEEYKLYERQARIALLGYKGKTLPKTVGSMWH